MKRITLLIPLLGLTAFGGYYHRWDAGQRARTFLDAKDPLAAYAHRSGHDDATRDLAQGRRRLFTSGEPVEWQKEYTGLLNRIYRIEVESLPAGPARESVERYTADYNAVMRHELTGIHGPDLFRNTQAMAEQLHSLNTRIARYVTPL